MTTLAELYAAANERNALARRNEPLDRPVYAGTRGLPAGNQKWGDVASMAIQNAPGIGDVASLIEAYKLWKAGDTTGGLLSGIGALPVVASMSAGPIKDLLKANIGAPELRAATDDALQSALSAVRARNAEKGLDADIATGAIRDEIARRNAVTMLGLPESNTAADRAGAMGFDTPAYHGTDAGAITEFDPKVARATYVSLPQLRPGSKTQAQHIADGPFGGVLYPLQVNKGDRSPNMLQWPDMPEAMDKNPGFDTYRVYEPSVQSESLAIPDSSRIRSRFAAFDPARRDEANLLASVAGLFGLSKLYQALQQQEGD